MFLLAKTLEGLGILCLLFGLIHGINSPKLWGELYFTIIGIVLFLAGWGIEKYLSRKKPTG